MITFTVICNYGIAITAINILFLKCLGKKLLFFHFTQCILFENTLHTGRERDKNSTYLRNGMTENVGVFETVTFSNRGIP